MTKFTMVKLTTIGTAVGGIVGGIVGGLAGLLLGSGLASTINSALMNTIGFCGTKTITLLSASGWFLPNANIVIDLGRVLGSITGGISAGGAGALTSGGSNSVGFAPCPAF